MTPMNTAAQGLLDAMRSGESKQLAAYAAAVQALALAELAESVSGIGPTLVDTAEALHSLASAVGHGGENGASALESVAARVHLLADNVERLK